MGWALLGSRIRILRTSNQDGFGVFTFICSGRLRGGINGGFAMDWVGVVY